MSRHDWQNADPELRSELGGLVLSFSLLEESLRDVIWMIVGLDGLETHVLTYRMPFSRLVEKFKDLFALRYPSYDTEALGQFCNALGRAADERNDLIHALWEFASDGAAAHRHKVLKDKTKVLRLNTAAVTPAKVNELAERISQLDDKLWELINDQQPVA